MFILYKEKKLLHVRILKDYIDQYKGEKLDTIIMRAGENQTIYLSKNTEINPIMNANDVQEFLKYNSRKYNSIISAEELARGGEAVVYRVESTSRDEIVAKCSLFTSESPKEVIF